MKYSVKTIFIIYILYLLQNSDVICSNENLPIANMVASPVLQEEYLEQADVYYPEENSQIYSSYSLENEVDMTPLMKAIRNEENIGMIDILISNARNNEDINMQDVFGRTALHYAAMRAAHRDVDPVIVEHLIQNGASPRIQDANDKTPAQYAHSESQIYKILAPWNYYFLKKFNDTFRSL